MPICQKLDPCKKTVFNFCLKQVSLCTYLFSIVMNIDWCGNIQTIVEVNIILAGVSMLNVKNKTRCR